MIANDYECFFAKKVIFCWLVQKIIVILQKISYYDRTKQTFTLKNGRQNKP